MNEWFEVRPQCKQLATMHARAKRVAGFLYYRLLNCGTFLTIEQYATVLIHSQ